MPPACMQFGQERLALRIIVANGVVIEVPILRGESMVHATKSRLPLTYLIHVIDVSLAN